MLRMSYGESSLTLVYYAERRRLSKLGKNPDSVRWVSKGITHSPTAVLDEF